MKRILSLLHLLLLWASAPSLHAQSLTFRVAEFGIDQFDMTAQEAERYDVDGRLYALVKVTSDIENDDLNAFKFDFGYLESIKEMHDGELWLFVQRNAKRMTITREGYKKVEHTFQAIQAGRTYRLHLSVQTPEVKRRVLQFKVDPADEGAIVKVKREDSNEDFQLWGAVDAGGTIDRLLPTGGYLYEVSADNYVKATGMVNLTYDSGIMVERVKLMPNFGLLQLNDEYGIAGAEVYIDDKKVGTIPLEPLRLACRDGYHLMLSKGELYKTFSTTFDIRQGETTVLSPKIESNFAETTIQVEGNAEIYIDGERRGIGSWTGPLAEGTYNVEARLANHRSSKRQISVKRDVQETFVIEQPQPIEGSLYVSSTPSGAEILIDNQNTGKVTPWTFENILIGPHQVAIKLAKHQTATEHVTIEEKNIAEIKVNLKESANNYSRNTIANNVSNEPAISQPKRHAQSKFFDSWEFYLQPTFQLGAGMGVGASVGCYLKNFNMEAQYLNGLAKETVILKYETTAFSDNQFYTVTPSFMQYSGKIGWGIPLGNRFRLTPQLGVHQLTILEHVNDDPLGREFGAWCFKGSVGVRAEVALANHFSVVVTPSYEIAMKKSDNFAVMSDYYSKIKGWGTGFNCAVGLSLFF